MKRTLITCIVMLGCLKAFCQTTIPVKEAAKHINEQVTVCDKIYGGKFFSNSNLTLLDVGGNHPNEGLTLVIKGEVRKKFKVAPEEAFKGKNICVTGTIIDFKGKPEMMITGPEQIKEAM